MISSSLFKVTNPENISTMIEAEVVSVTKAGSNVGGSEKFNLNILSLAAEDSLEVLLSNPGATFEFFPTVLVFVSVVSPPHEIIAKATKESENIFIFVI